MPTSILTTKLNIPPPPANLVPRPRLLDKLNQGLDHKLTLVSTAAGYGKTTLISHWIHKSLSTIENLQFSWLSLDENDNDPVQFLTYLIAALQKIDPHLGQTALAMMLAPQPPPAQTCLTNLINDIARIDHPLILVLDDYHLIHSLPIHESLSFLLEHQPAHIHLVIASREDPPLSLPRLRGRGQIVEIRQDDLRFSVEECADFLQRVMGLDLSADDINALESRTEGWIAGLQLAALSMRGSPDPKDFVRLFTGSNRFVLDYLVEEVFGQQPVEVQQFLLKTSILEQLSAPLCDAVAECSDSKDLLLGLEQANLFVVPLDQSREWYRYHRLFAELLRHQLRTLGSYTEASFHVRACQWYETNGFLPQAVHHALAACDWNEAARVIGLAALQTIQIGQLATVHGWLEALPDPIVRRSLNLATVKGWTSLMMGEFKAAGMYAELAEDLLPTDTPTESRALLILLHASLALTRQDLPKTIALSQETLEIIGESDYFFLRGLALNNLAQAHMLVGDLPAATATFREMIRQSPKIEQSPTTISAWANLAALLHQGGRRREANALCQEVLDRCVDAHGRPLPLAGYIHIPMRMLYYEVNDLTLARQHLLHGVEYGKQLGALTGVASSGLIALTQLQQAAGEAHAALATIGQIRQLIARYDLGYLEFMVSGVEADILLKQGNLAAAERWAETAGLSPADMPNPLRESEYFTFARLLLAQNQLDEVDTLLANFEQFAQNGGRQRSLITVYILQALLQEASGNGKQAIARLGMALRLAAPEDYRRAFLDQGQPLIDLLPKARHLAPGFVDQLLSDAQAEADIQMPSHRVQPLVEPLSDRELEVLRLLSDGLSNREIADRLIISVGTVKTHLHNIYSKLEVRGRTQAVTRAREFDLI